MTQKELASLAGTSQPTIASYEAGDKSPTVATLMKLARAAGLEAYVSFVPIMSREDQRSLAYHRVVADLLRQNSLPVITKARSNLSFMRKKHPKVELFGKWRQWLDLPIENLTSHLLDPGILSRDMRQVSPFAGVLSPKKRWRALRQFQKERG